VSTLIVSFRVKLVGHARTIFHQGQTPAQRAGIGVNSKNKWLKLLENSLINDDTSQKNPMRYRTIATIVVISALLVFFLVPIQPSGFLPCPEGQSCATYYRSYSCQFTNYGDSYDRGYGLALGCVPRIF